MYYAPFFDVTKGSKEEELGVVIGYEEEDMYPLTRLAFFLEEHFHLAENSMLNRRQLAQAVDTYPYCMVNGNHVTLPELIQIIDQLMESPTLVEIGFLYADAKTFHAYKAELVRESDDFACVKECYESAMKEFFPTERH